MYDRYTHRIYDVVPLGLVHNLPDEVSNALNDYEYLLVEEGKASDFTERRVCHSCDRWCNPDEAVVKCVACKEAYHLGCANLSKKPPKGYAWQCAKCGMRAIDAAEEEENKLGKSRAKTGKKATDAIEADLEKIRARIEEPDADAAEDELAMIRAHIEKKDAGAAAKEKNNVQKDQVKTGKKDTGAAEVEKSNVGKRRAEAKKNVKSLLSYLSDEEPAASSVEPQAKNGMALPFIVNR